MRNHITPDDDAADEPRRTYNLAPGNHGLICRAITSEDIGPSARDAHPGSGGELPDPALADPRSGGDLALKQRPGDSGSATIATYKLQPMRWGLVPSWTKGDATKAKFSRTINCRAESLARPGGLWAPMKAKQRCVVAAMGFYEWLHDDDHAGTKRKTPYFVRRRDEQPVFFAGLWDCVRRRRGADQVVEHQTFTIVTTASSGQLRFLHDRMPVILEPGSEEFEKWLDPSTRHWSVELQSILAPYGGQLDVYPVSREVGRVGNDSPSFVVPLTTEPSQHKIAGFFGVENKSVKSSGALQQPPFRALEDDKSLASTGPDPNTIEPSSDQGDSSPESETRRDVKASPTVSLKRSASEEHIADSQPPAKARAVSPPVTTAQDHTTTDDLKPKFSSRSHSVRLAGQGGGEYRKITDFFQRET